MPKEIIPNDKIPVLEDEQVLKYGSAIVPTPMIPMIWKSQTGRTYDRSAPLHARHSGKLVPMGKNRNRLYFWREDVERAVPSTHLGAPPGSNPGKQRKKKTGLENP